MVPVQCHIAGKCVTVTVDVFVLLTTLKINLGNTDSNFRQKLSRSPEMSRINVNVSEK